MTEPTPEEKLLNLIKNSQSKAMIGKDLKIFKKINILLAGIIGIVAVIFVADVFIFKQRPVEKPVVETQVQIPEAQMIAEKIEEDDTKDQASQDKDVEVKKASKEEIIGNLNLLGIITGDNNQAIIEDKALKKTFFLYKGDSLGELTVYDIKDNMVILEYKGERIILKM